MKQSCLFKLLFIAFILFLQPINAYAQTEEEDVNAREDNVENQMLEDISLTSIDPFWQEIRSQYEQFIPKNQKKSLKQLITEKQNHQWSDYLKAIIQYILYEIIQNGGLMGSLLLLAIFSAVLESVQTAFEKNTIGKLAYFIVYIVLIYIALNSFFTVFDYAKATVSTMSNFMIALLPLLLGLMASFGQVVTVAFFHPVIIFFVHISGLFINYIIFPLLYLAVLILVIGEMNETFKIDKMATFIKTICIGALGVFVSLFLGIISIQGTTSAIEDGVALKTTKFVTGNFIPVVGRTFTDAAETVLSALLLMKNAVGIIGLFILLFIVLFPVLKILVISLIYKLCAALLQPIGAPPVINTLDIISKYMMYILACVITMAFMFLVSIVIMMIASNIPIILQ